MSVVFGVFGRFTLVFGLASYPPGPIVESVFLWRVSVDRSLPVASLANRPAKQRGQHLLNEACASLAMARHHPAELYLDFTVNLQSEYPVVAHNMAHQAHTPKPPPRQQPKSLQTEGASLF